MINIDSEVLKSFIDENKDFFINAKIQKIQQPTRKDIIIHLRNNSESRKLYININPQAYHIAFMTKENENRRHLSIPQHPPMFCMLLRKHMEGAKIININKPDFERVIELYFEKYNEIGERIEECLSIELMGKHSNLVLYNTDTNIILGCAHNIGTEKSKERELAGGLPFIYPPKQDKKNLLNIRYNSFLKLLKTTNINVKKIISEKYYSISQFIVEEVCIKNNINPEIEANRLNEEQIQLIYINLKEYLLELNHKYTMSSDYEKYSPINTYPKRYDSVNNLLDDYYAFQTEKLLIVNLKSNLENLINRELKKLKNVLINQQKQVDKITKAENYKLKADLIMSNLYNLNTLTTPLILKNFTDGSDVIIDIDTNISFVDNANKLYTKYNKAKKAFNVAQDMMEETQNEILYYEEILFSVKNAEVYNDLLEIQQELQPDAKPLKTNITPEKANIKKFEINGFSIFIGKNNKQNDTIYSKLSSSDDIWMHVLNSPGCHLLIKTEKKDVDNVTLLECAKIAKEYSAAKNSTKVPVIYTLKKWVKRPPNQKGGFVTFKNEKEIIVE